VQRIVHRPMNYPIFGDSPRPVDWDHDRRTESYFFLAE
jgi:hypothetical protein